MFSSFVIQNRPVFYFLTSNVLNLGKSSGYAEVKTFFTYIYALSDASAAGDCSKHCEEEFGQNKQFLPRCFELFPVIIHNPKS